MLKVWHGMVDMATGSTYVTIEDKVSIKHVGPQKNVVSNSVQIDDHTPVIGAAPLKVTKALPSKLTQCKPVDNSFQLCNSSIPKITDESTHPQPKKRRRNASGLIV